MLNYQESLKDFSPSYKEIWRQMEVQVLPDSQYEYILELAKKCKYIDTLYDELWPEYKKGIVVAYLITKEKDRLGCVIISKFNDRYFFDAYKDDVKVPHFFSQLIGKYLLEEVSKMGITELYSCGNNKNKPAKVALRFLGFCKINDFNIGDNSYYLYCKKFNT